MGIARLLVPSVALFVMACGPRAASPSGPAPSAPGTLLRPSSFPVALHVDQTVRATYGEREVSFRAVVEKDGDRLVMIGLAPHGGRAFTLVLDGTSVDMQSSLDEPLPFDPVFMLHDVERTWLRAATLDAPEGDHARTILDGDTIEEEWSEGRLVRRTFTRSDREGQFEVVFEGGLAPIADAPIAGAPTTDAPIAGAAAGATSPTRVRIHNGWFGYDLELTELTVERTRESLAETPSAPSEVRP